jgi:shikimate kinase
VLAELIDRRYPIYAEADITIDSGNGPPDATASRAIAALERCARTRRPQEVCGA